MQKPKSTEEEIARLEKKLDEVEEKLRALAEAEAESESLAGMPSHEDFYTPMVMMAKVVWGIILVLGIACYVLKTNGW